VQRVECGEYAHVWGGCEALALFQHEALPGSKCEFFGPRNEGAWVKTGGGAVSMVQVLAGYPAHEKTLPPVPYGRHVGRALWRS